MGLLGRGQARKNTRRSELEAAKARISRSFELDIWAEEDRRESERMGSLPRRSYVKLDVDAPGFPFAPGTYVGAQDHIGDDGTEMHGIWYADAAAVRLVVEAVDDLVRMLNIMTPMARIRADMSNVRPVEDTTSYLPEHYAWAYLNPPAPTGRSPKYVASIEFVAGLERPRHMTIEEMDRFVKEHPSPEQSSGKIDYLPDGRIGKARLSLWDKPYFYIAYYKLMANELVVSRYTRDLEGKTEILYRVE